MSCSQAVSDDFYFQMYYDNLPIWGFIGARHSINLITSRDCACTASVQGTHREDGALSCSILL